MIDSQDVNEQELEVLKGDAVGNNLCSSKWIINTLMSLCEVHKNGWTEELEDQLCILWDLTLEAEVTSYLISCDFLKIARNALEIYDQPRLIEIILGIIGNTCCNHEVIDTIGCDKNLVTQILNRLISDDTPTLIQLLRILQLITCRIRENPQSDWIIHFKDCEFFGDSIIFMLKSSTNDDLLTAAINLLKSISQINLPHQKSFLEGLFKIDDLVPALLESFMQVIPIDKINYSATELTFIEHWLGILITIMELDSLKFEDYENDENFSKLMEIMYRILKPYKESCNLFPIQQLNANVIDETTRVLLSFHCCDVNVPPRIDHIIATIIFFLKETDSEREGLDPEELMVILSNHLDQYWLQIIELCTSEEIMEILCLCEHDICEYLVNFVQSDSKVTPEMLEKMKKALITFKKS